jgi:hypothetical protein
MRWLATGGGVLLAAALVAVATRSGHATPPVRSDASPSAGPPVSGPVVYYELVDATASRLFVRTLDGRSEPREIASRTDIDQGPAWSVDPTSRLGVAIVGVPGKDDDRDLVAYSVADGRQAWTVHVASTFTSWLRWAPDGTSLAVLTESSQADRRDVAVIDAATGAVRSVQVPREAGLLGFAADGGVIVWEVVNDGEADSTFRFLRIDPGTLAVERLTTLPDVGPDATGTRSIDPRIGAVVDVASAEDQAAVQVRLRDLRTGASRVLATTGSVDLVSIDPDGSGVVVTADGAARMIAFDGSAFDLVTGDDSISELTWSPDGAYVLIETSGPPERLLVVERSTGRVVSLPLPRVSDAHLVAVPGGPPLPAQPLPTGEPVPTPTAAPSGADVAGMPVLLSSWLATENGRLVGHVQRLVPTEAGGIRVAAEMPPIDLGPAPPLDDRSTGIRLLPRPGSGDVLVWISSDDESHGVLWDGATGVHPLVLPAGWPKNAADAVWRPDGGALAGTAVDASPDGGFASAIVIATPGERRVTTVPYAGDYDRLEGWWSMTELRVGHGVCTEGCPGRYSYSARLRVSDGRLRQLTPADRGRQPIDFVISDPATGRITMTMASEAPESDLSIAWPADLGPVDLADGSVASDARSLIVVRTVETGTEVYRIEDVVGRAARGVLADPEPVRIGTLTGRGSQLEFAPGEGWAVVTDRVGDVTLVRFGDGRLWALGSDRDLTWVTPSS